jgi:hypothetical protein
VYDAFRRRRGRPDNERRNRYRSRCSAAAGSWCDADPWRCDAEHHHARGNTWRAYDDAGECHDTRCDSRTDRHDELRAGGRRLRARYLTAAERNESSAFDRLSGEAAGGQRPAGIVNSRGRRQNAKQQEKMQ